MSSLSVGSRKWLHLRPMYVQPYWNSAHVIWTGGQSRCYGITYQEVVERWTPSLNLRAKIRTEITSRDLIPVFEDIDSEDAPVFTVLRYAMVSLRRERFSKDFLGLASSYQMSDSCLLNINLEGCRSSGQRICLWWQFDPIPLLSLSNLTISRKFSEWLYHELRFGCRWLEGFFGANNRPHVASFEWLWPSRLVPTPHLTHTRFKSAYRQLEILDASFWVI
jgi:hypothetical protein